jgi:hypothetical protein
MSAKYLNLASSIRYSFATVDTNAVRETATTHTANRWVQLLHSSNQKKYQDMNRTHFLMLVLSSLIIYSCDKESIDPFDQEIEQFKHQTKLQFGGTILDNQIYWRFDNWENGIGASYQSCWNLTDDIKIQNRSFSIYDYDERSHVIVISFSSPAFSIDSSYEYKKSIFDIGIKQYKTTESNIFQGFEISITTIDEVLFTKYGDQSNSTLEIVKLQELTREISDAADYKRIRLWIIVSCKLYNSGGQIIGSIENGKLLAEIEIERNN